MRTRLGESTFLTLRQVLSSSLAGGADLVCLTRRCRGSRSIQHIGEHIGGTCPSVERWNFPIYRHTFFFPLIVEFFIKKESTFFALTPNFPAKIKPFFVRPTLSSPDLCMGAEQWRKPGFIKALPKHLPYPRITFTDISRKPTKLLFGSDFLTSTEVNKILLKINSFGKFRLTMSLYIVLRVYTSIPSFKALAMLTFTSVKMFS